MSEIEREVRNLPQAVPRVETGVVQFEQDWPGVFLRGDYCFALVPELIRALHDMARGRASPQVQCLLAQPLLKSLCAVLIDSNKDAKQRVVLHELLAEAVDVVKAVQDAASDRADTAGRAWEDLSYDDRLTAAEHIFRALVEHAQKGGTYRYLIYDRLGFDLDAYAPLFEAGGMEISNEFMLEMDAADESDLALARKAKAAIERVAPVVPFPPARPPNPDRMVLYDLVYRMEDLSKQLKQELKKRPKLEREARETPRAGEG